jgi:hypothetical protein
MIYLLTRASLFNLMTYSVWGEPFSFFMHLTIIENDNNLQIEKWYEGYIHCTWEVDIMTRKQLEPNRKIKERCKRKAAKGHHPIRKWMQE